MHRFRIAVHAKEGLSLSLSIDPPAVSRKQHPTEVDRGMIKNLCRVIAN